MSVPKDVPYRNKKEEEFPLWLANVKYEEGTIDPEIGYRERYIDSALMPFDKGYAFYSLRNNLYRHELEKAKAAERAKRIRHKK